MLVLGPPEISFWQHAVKILAVLSAILGVLLLAVQFFKKYRIPRLGAPSLIRILETRYLTPKSTLHLVAVGPDRFLVGNTGEHLTLLTALPPDREAAQQDLMTETSSTSWRAK
jgi:flagellar biogenesis protein FliO